MLIQIVASFDKVKDILLMQWICNLPIKARGIAKQKFKGPNFKMAKHSKSWISLSWTCFRWQINLAIGEKREIVLPEIVTLMQNFCYKSSTVSWQVMFWGKSTSNKRIWCILHNLNIVLKIEWSCGGESPGRKIFWIFWQK